MLDGILIPPGHAAHFSSLAPAVVAIVESNSGSGSQAGRVLDGLHPLLEHYLAANFYRAATTAFGGSTGALFDVWVNVQKRDLGGVAHDIQHIVDAVREARDRDRKRRGG